jgi:hypothetical protein
MTAQPIARAAKRLDAEYLARLSPGETRQRSLTGINGCRDAVPA